MISDLRGESAASRRTFLRRSAAAGAGALALSAAGSNATLAHEIDDEDASDVDDFIAVAGVLENTGVWR